MQKPQVKHQDHIEFIESLSNLSDKIKAEYDIQVPATWFQEVVSAHAKVISKIERKNAKIS